MEPTFGFLVSDVARLLRKAFDQRARQVGLSLTQCRAILYLTRHEGINQAGLAELMEVQPISLARLIDRMSAAGWIERRPDPHDRRAHLLYLTEKARPLLDQIEGFAAEIRAGMVPGISEEEMARTMNVLTRIHANIGTRLPATAAAGQDNDLQDDEDNEHTG